jgi:hypothetical protein
MRLLRSCILLCSLVAASFSAAVSTVSAALDRFGLFLIDTVALAGKPLALAGMPNTPMTIDGVALARSTQQGLRHEAGVSRRASARKG